MRRTNPYEAFRRALGERLSIQAGCLLANEEATECEYAIAPYLSVDRPEHTATTLQYAEDIRTALEGAPDLRAAGIRAFVDPALDWRGVGEVFCELRLKVPRDEARAKALGRKLADALLRLFG